MVDAAGAAGVAGSGTVERDGLVFDVTTAGPADGEPVVLLHGLSLIHI